MNEENLAKLERLAELRSRGVLTEQEFQEQKAKLGMSTTAFGNDVAAPTRDTPPALEPDIEETESESRRDADGAEPVTPRWAKRPKKRDLKLPLVIGLVGLLATVGAVAFWMTRERSVAEEFLVVSEANIRSSPTTRSAISHKLIPEDVILGEVVDVDGEKWVRITEGDFSGGYVWSKNLRNIGPDALSQRGGPKTEPQGLAQVSGTSLVTEYSNGEFTLEDNSANSTIGLCSPDGRACETFDRVQINHRPVDLSSRSGCLITLASATLSTNADNRDLLVVKVRRGCAAGMAGAYRPWTVEEAAKPVSQTNVASLTGEDEMFWDFPNAELNVCTDQAAAERVVRRYQAAQFVGSERRRDQIETGCRGEVIKGGSYILQSATILGEYTLVADNGDGYEEAVIGVVAVKARTRDGREIWATASAMY